MTNDKINALLASAYNLHVGPRVGGAALTPASASNLKRADKLALCVLLENNGGSDLYTADDARKAYAAIA